jgi:ketosteroid isomerase-like protein
MAHPNEQMLRQLYAAFGRGDMQAVLGSCTDDVVFHVPGRSRLAGDYDRSGFPAMIGKVMELSAGTFREDVLDVLVGQDHGAALLRHRLERGGTPIEYTTLHVWRLRDGKCAEWWEHPRDQYAFDQVWS